MPTVSPECGGWGKEMSPATIKVTTTPVKTSSFSNKLLQMRFTTKTSRNYLQLSCNHVKYNNVFWKLLDHKQPVCF